MGPRAWGEITANCIADETQPANIKCLEALFSNAISALVGAAGLALFIMLIVGGFRYLTAGGNAQATESARSIMFWAIAGVVLMIFSYIILRLIEWFTGVRVTIFEIPYFAP